MTLTQQPHTQRPHTQQPHTQQPHTQQPQAQDTPSRARLGSQGPPKRPGPGRSPARAHRAGIAAVVFIVLAALLAVLAAVDRSSSQDVTVGSDEVAAVSRSGSGRSGAVQEAADPDSAGESNLTTGRAAPGTQSRASGDDAFEGSDETTSANGTVTAETEPEPIAPVAPATDDPDDDDQALTPGTAPVGANPNPGNSAWTEGILPATDAPAPAVTPVPTSPPVSLSLVAAVHPVVEPDPGPPVPLPVMVDQGALGLTSNAVGCEAQCITTAVLSRQALSPNLDLAVSTNVDTTKTLWLLPPGPFVVNGVPVFVGKAPIATSGSAGKAWNYAIGSLQHDTTYRVVLVANDLYGNTELATTLVTTNAARPGALVAPGSPCYFDCISTGVVKPGPTFDVSTIRVEATAAVEFHIAVSTSQPGTIAGNPFLPEDVEFDVTSVHPTWTEGQLTGLAPDTLYHVVVKATDDEGFSHYAVGEFRTLPEPPPAPEPVPEPTTVEVLLWFERFFVHQDGDTVGRGEIEFEYGVSFPDGGSENWWIPQQKVDSGEAVQAGGGTVVAVETGGILPELFVWSSEHDVFFSEVPCEVGDVYEDDCGGTTSRARLQGASLDWIDTLPTCANYGFTGYAANDRCAVLQSNNNGDESVVFDALVAFRVLS